LMIPHESDFNALKLFQDLDNQLFIDIGVTPTYPFSLF
jgi:hypothetical protein